MCRLMVFAGACTECGMAHTWDDLTQELPCLEAKNAGAFGECAGGVRVDRHPFDQECDRCADEDEGVVVSGEDVEEDGDGDGGHDSGGDKKRRRTS